MNTLAQAKGATSIGTPCFQLVPSTLESLRESATRMKCVAASASTFSRSWQAPPPLQDNRVSNEGRLSLEGRA